MEAIQIEKYKGYDISVRYYDSPESPRIWDNVVTFVCSHRQYTLGDRQDMDDCINELFDKHVNAKNIVAYFIKSRNARWVQNGTEDYDGPYDKYLEWNDGKDYFGVDEGTPDEDIAYNNINDELTNGEKLKLIKQSGNVIISLISMYEHSGIALQLGVDTSCVDSIWDWSWVGFAYVEKDMAKREHMLDPGDYYNHDWKAWASDRIKDEIYVYNKYLQGEVYGYNIENGTDNFEASCWGYFGYDTIPKMIEEAKNVIDSHLESKERARKENCIFFAKHINDFIGHTWVLNNELFRIIKKHHYGCTYLQKAEIDNGHVSDYVDINISDVQADALDNIVNFIKKQSNIE